MEETTGWDVRTPPEDIREVYGAGACEIDLGRRELRVRGSSVPVGARAFQIIEVLARSAGALVTKDELLDRIWPGATVGENTLHVHAGVIRKALGPYRNLLQTESGRGYRLLGDWTVRDHIAREPPEDIRAVYAADACEIDLARRELRVRGSSVPVGARAFQIIEVLAGSAGELVTKDELLDRIWPGATVGDNTLPVHVAALRKALGPYRNLLKTESGRGYRLLGDWTLRHHGAAGPPAGVHAMRVSGGIPATNFPATVTRLIGRTAAVARLRDLTSAYRVVTLTGPGGIGKSSLALQVARGVVDEFADGGWLVELASLSDPTLAPAAVAGVLNLPLGSNSATPESVARAIGDKKLLLVLNNCEHLVGAVAILAETLLTLCAHITIIATSREILRIQGEHVYRVPPLDVPPLDVPAAGQSDAAQILTYSAPELFIARASELDADFASNSQHSSMIAAICRRLDGIPLAIEFAAARAATLGVAQVAKGLHNRFELLTGGRRTALPRHRTLRATLDWSYQLLTEAERDLLQRLAIFVGPFSLDAAGAVADAGTTASGIADGIVDLNGKSLVFKFSDFPTAEFRLLETTRVYAFERLTESGALSGVAHRHAGYLLTALGGIEDEQRSKPQDEYLAAFRRRADEIHAALDWAFSATGDRSIGLTLTIAAVPLWFELSHFNGTAMTVVRGRVEQALPHAGPAPIRKCGCGSPWATRFGTWAQAAPTRNRPSPARWKSPSKLARPGCGPGRYGGCGQGVAVAAIISPRLSSRAATRMPPPARVTSVPCISLTASWD